MQAVGSGGGGVHGDRARVIVPPTPAGVASALSVVARANSDATPAEVLARPESDPPSIEIALGAEMGGGPELAPGDVECTVPPRLDALFVVAPLAHYLGATVDVEQNADPRLRVRKGGVDHALPPMPRLQDAVADLLDHLVTLDRLVVDGRDAVGELPVAEIDSEWAARAPPGDRLAAYLDVPAEETNAVSRGWDLAMYVDPTPEHVDVLPHLLQRPCTIYVPEAATLEREDVIRRSLEDFSRSHSPPELDVDLVTPTRHRGRVRGWLANGVAVDAFKADPAAYENRLAHRAREHDHHVRVVLNESEMAAEVATVERIYRERAASLGVHVDVDRGLTCTELAAAIERPSAFLHYVGHCDEEGLRCADGHLPIERVTRSRARTFLLNACGSYREGRSLIRRGSVAGAVTLNPVIDEQAAKVGIAFAQLVMCGFSIERALRIARRRAIMNKDYVVVGDGTYALACEDLPGGRIERREGDRFRFVLDGVESQRDLAVTVTRSELVEYLGRAEVPIEYEGRTTDASALYDALVAETTAN